MDVILVGLLIFFISLTAYHVQTGKPIPISYSIFGIGFLVTLGIANSALDGFSVIVGVIWGSFLAWTALRR